MLILTFLYILRKQISYDGGNYILTEYCTIVNLNKALS